jgi:predicted aconitase with swiveling domain
MISNDYIGPADGIYRENGHELDGIKVAGKVLVFPVAKGSSVVAHSLLGAKLMGGAPAAMVFDRASTIQVQATILAQIPAVYGLEEGALQAIKNGTIVKVNADYGTVEVL